MVSELLGSFGDNELSPECLDGAQKFLRFPHGVSIPYEYTSWVAPVSSSKLWNDVKAFSTLKAIETPYVVKLFEHALLSEPVPCFTFRHPSWRNDDGVSRERREVGEEKRGEGLGGRGGRGGEGAGKGKEKGEGEEEEWR